MNEWAQFLRLVGVVLLAVIGVELGRLRQDVRRQTKWIQVARRAIEWQTMCLLYPELARKDNAYLKDYPRYDAEQELRIEMDNKLF